MKLSILNLLLGFVATVGILADATFAQERNTPRGFNTGECDKGTIDVDQDKHRRLQQMMRRKSTKKSTEESTKKPTGAPTTGTPTTAAPTAAPTVAPLIYTCKNPMTVNSTVLTFKKDGWSGLSCPTVDVPPMKVFDCTVAAEPSSSFQAQSKTLWKSGAIAGGVTYPSTPFGSIYGTGEEGCIVQAKKAGKATITLTCCSA